MRLQRLLQSSLLLAAAVLGWPVLAQSPHADIEQGRRVVLGLGEPGMPRTECFTCHGADGAGDASGAFPRLTGQSAWYLYKQLKDYASGARENAVMSPVASELSDADMQAVAGYYASRTAPAVPRTGQPDPLTLQQGGAIAATGASDRGVTACGFCHGEDGRGLAPSFPYLAGQHAAYMELQLQNWKEGERSNDPMGVMAEIAHALTIEEIRAVSLYFAAIEHAAPASEAAQQ